MMKNVGIFFAHLIATLIGIVLAIAFACLIWFIAYGEMPNLNRSPDNLCPPHDFSVFLSEKDSTYSHYETYACCNCDAVTTHIK